MSHPLLPPGRVAAALAVLALAVAGCGDDPERDGVAAPRSASPAKAAFIERGNEVLCAKSRRVTAATVTQVLGGRDSAADELALVREEVLPAFEKAYDGLAALPVPPGDEQAVSRLMGSLRSALVAAEAEPALVLGHRDPFAQVDRELAGYGLDGCA